MKSHMPTDSNSRHDPQERCKIIEQCLAAVGQTWAAEYINEMSTDHRPVQGGWPGRLAEARALALRDLVQHLAARGMPAPSPDELTRAPAIVNDHARQQWARACKTQRLALQASRASTSK
jgi:hypothetical protein